MYVYVRGGYISRIEKCIVVHRENLNTFSTHFTELEKIGKNVS
jgi:hypothetical protein